MEVGSCAPPGFRFHPTEEELVGYYLRRKVASQRFDIEFITEIDLYNIEPWDLQDRCKLGYEEQNEWYFFSHKDRKYPGGARTNRATAAGFWKATGRDKAILLSRSKAMIGMRKTLVFYQGRAPNGRKSDWIMHEYRLQSCTQQQAPSPPQEEGWVVCRAFRKQSPSPRTQCFSNYNPADYFLNKITSSAGDFSHEPPHGFEFRNEAEENHSTVFEIPQLLESPGFSSSSSFVAQDCSYETSNSFIDWKNLDKLLAEPASCFNSNMLMNCADSGMNGGENCLIACFRDS